MNHSPAKILQKLLITQGLFGDPLYQSPVFPLYVAFMPELQQGLDNVGTIYDYEGVKDGRYMTGKNVVHHGIQLRVRSVDYDVGYDTVERARAAFEDLPPATQVVIGPTTYKIWNISQTSSILYLGLEEGAKRRFQFTMNFLATIEDAGSTINDDVIRGVRLIRRLRQLRFPPSLLKGPGTHRRTHH